MKIFNKKREWNREQGERRKEGGEGGIKWKRKGKGREGERKERWEFHMEKGKREWIRSNFVSE